MARAIVSGALANKPCNGGEAWVRLSWLLGLGRLGFDTYFVEQIGADDCTDGEGGTGFAGSVNRAYFESVVRDFGLESRSSLICDGGREVAGLSLDEIGEATADADVLINIGGHLTLGDLLDGPRTSVYVDLDPGFTQAWHADGGVPFSLPRHDHYVTIGLNLGSPSCPIPDCGVDWIPTLPPVLLEEWPQQQQPQGPARFTTVATWRSPYGGLQIGGRTMGLKHHEFRRLIELPQRVEGAVFEIALDIHRGDSADLEALREHGWAVVDPGAVRSPQSFREYIAASSAEFSVAQGVYTESASGWFSDRTAAYLASGRPALVQETGLPETLSGGGGLLGFSGLEDAVVAATRIEADRGGQSEMARGFAERHLDSDLVLERLLAPLGIEP